MTIDGTDLALEQSYSTFSQPNLSPERVAVSAGAIYLSQELEGSATTNLALDGLAQTGEGEVLLTLITGAAAGTNGTE